MILRAFFGHPTNVLKTFDVTEPIGIMAAKSNKQKQLIIPRTLNLIQAFGEPCRGIRKALTINYRVMGMSGTFVLSTNNGGRQLRASLVLGYPLEKKDYGVDGSMGFSERMTMSSLKTKQTARERLQTSGSLRLWSNESSTASSRE
jgi:hypothetical protein